jgi:cobalt/nickel transport system permease protein
MLFLIVSVVLITDPVMAAVSLVIAIIIAGISRLPARFIVKRLAVVLPFIVSLCLIILFTNKGGTEIARFLFLSINTEGLNRSFLIFSRASAAVIIVICMLGTMKFEITLQALNSMKVPVSITQLLMFTYRYIFVFIDEFSRMSRSLYSRGFQTGTNLHTLMTLSKMIGMLFIKSYERADRVYNAMISRGYEGTIRTLAEFTLNRMDRVKAGSAVVTGIALHITWFIGV